MYALLPAGCRVWPRCPLKQPESYIRRNLGMGPGCCPLGYTEHWLPGQWPDCTRWSKSHPVREGKTAEMQKLCAHANFAGSFLSTCANRPIVIWTNVQIINWMGHLRCQGSLWAAVKVGQCLSALHVTCRRTRGNSNCVIEENKTMHIIHTKLVGGLL